jgi:multiple sugar transport system substrate-binding protein
MKKTMSLLGFAMFLFVLVPVCVVAQDAKFGLNGIPDIANKKPLNIIIETGDAHGKTLPAIEAFAAKTGVKVNVERVASSGVYGKENVELMAGTGFYDLVYVETSWTTEWSDYLYKVKDLANKYDPGKEAALAKDLAYMSPSILACGQAYGDQMVLPFYTFDMAMWVRQDVFDDPTEKAEFKKKFGTELQPARTEAELMKLAQFFTRKKGELLKGQPLDHDIYGLSMQAGAYQCNDETSARLWAKNQDWVTVVRDASGKISKFVITKADKQALKEALTEYKTELQWDSPGALTANFDFVVAQMGNGNAIICPTIWANCTVWADGILREKVPGGKIGIYPTAGGHPYTGAWSFGVSKDSKNPEAAYWLLRYLASYDCANIIFKQAGMIPARMDVLEDPAIHQPANYYPLGMLADYHINIWKATAKYVPNYWYFNTKAGGKVYDMQIYAISKALTGEQTIDQVVENVTKQTLDLTSKFDRKVPISEEK